MVGGGSSIEESVMRYPPFFPGRLLQTLGLLPQGRTRGLHQEATSSLNVVVLLDVDLVGVVLVGVALVWRFVLGVVLVGVALVQMMRCSLALVAVLVGRAAEALAVPRVRLQRGSRSGRVAWPRLAAAIKC